MLKELKGGHGGITVAFADNSIILASAESSYLCYAREKSGSAFHLLQLHFLVIMTTFSFMPIRPRNSINEEEILLKWSAKAAQ